MKQKRLGRILGLSLAGLVVILAVIFAYIMLVLPVIPVPDLKVRNDSETIENGRYLAQHVMVCIDCHSTRDWSKFSGPVIAGTEGRGGERFDQRLGFPGVFYAKNITPYGLKNWTDGEVYRAITSGVTKTRKVIFPVMPFQNYGKMDSKDIYAIISYIRTLPPISYNVPESDPDFPMNIILHLIPEKPKPSSRPSKDDVLKYGEYLVRGSSCVDCHTIFEDGKYDMRMAFAGGREFDIPSGVLRSANITPDQTTGIGTYTVNSFVSKFKNFDPAKNQTSSVGQKDFNTIMPWTMYAGMTEEDLSAIFKYLSTLKPIMNQVVKFSPLK